MNSEFLVGALESYEAMRVANQVSVRIDNDEVVRLVITDLISKYKHNVRRADPEWVPAFEKILGYYLSKEELTAAIDAAKQQDNGTHRTTEQQR